MIETRFDVQGVGMNQSKAEQRAALQAQIAIQRASNAAKFAGLAEVLDRQQYEREHVRKGSRK